MATDKAKMSFVGQLRSMEPNFWVACFMEILERLAFFGVRAIAPLYLVAQAGKNGLGLSYAEKGYIYTVWALLQCLIPMVSGGYTDRYGYRKSLVVAFFINIIGYLCMAQSKPLADYLVGCGWDGSGFWVFMFAACLVATGTAIFKPPAHGMIARSTTEETSSMGWGIFYWVVNIGGALAPMGAAVLRVEIDWQNVFYAAAIVTALNFLPAFLLFREPDKSDVDTSKGPFGVFYNSIVTIIKDVRLLVFLGIFSCFWLMFMQLWDLLPNFIDEWVDTSDVAGVFGWFSDGWVLGNGQVKPEMIINIDSIAIIALVLLISWIIRKINKVAAMIIGMVIAMVGFVGAGATTLGWICCLMIFIFSIGEMACSPTFSAYIGLIAPKDKKALYMGYSNIPFAIGWALGNLVGGLIYDGYGAKATLALKHLAMQPALVADAARAADWSDSLEKIPTLLDIERDQALGLAASELGSSDGSVGHDLLSIFKHDQGQLENLALVYVMLHPKDADAAKKVEQRLIDAVTKEAEQKLADAAAEGVAGPVSIDPASIKPASVVHLLPSALKLPRGNALAAVRKRINDGLASDERKSDTEIAAMLWEEFGSDPDVLNNLALEYLAQSTGRVRDAVASITYESSPDRPKDRMEEIENRLGIGGGKSFDVLCAALGDRSTAEEKTASVPDSKSLSKDDRLYVYLAGLPRVRVEAVTRMDWDANLDLLREIVRTDDAVLELVRAKIDDEGFFAGVTNTITGMFSSGETESEVTEEGIDYRKLKSNAKLVQDAMAAKDWSKTPDQAARLLRVNPNEARALAAGDFNLANKTLWDTYNPAIVWYYLGGIGLLGTIGMIIFYFVTRNVRPEEEESGEVQES